MKVNKRNHFQISLKKQYNGDVSVCGVKVDENCYVELKKITNTSKPSLEK